MTETKFRFFEFGEFRLDAHRRILQKKGEPVHLTPRSFDLLCVLVANAGRILEHDELLEMVWEGTFVEQGNLKKTVSALRQALGESPEAGEFITTVPRRGYRFTAPVRTVPETNLVIRETTAEILVEEVVDDQSSTEQVLPAFSEKPRRRIFRPLTIFLIVVGLSVPAGFFASRYFSRRPENNFSVEKVRLTKVYAAGNVSTAMLSGDGNYFVYTVSENRKNSLRVRQTATGSEVEILPPMNASYWFPVFSPDGNYVYYFFSNREDPSKSGLYRVPALGGAPQLISEKLYYNCKFSPDGRRLAAVRNFSEDGHDRQELVTLNPDGSAEQKILTLPLFTLFRGIAWSPDGQTILCGITKNQPFEQAVINVSAVTLADGSVKQILPEQATPLVVDAWLPDGRSFLMRERERNAEVYQIWQYFFDSGEKRRVTNDNFTYNGLVLTADGKTIGALRSFGLTSVWTADVDKYELRQISDATGNFYSLGWTADDRLVFSATENGRDFVGIMKADGSQMRQLTEGGDGIRVSPEVSRDGKSVVFLSDRSDGRQVWNFDLDGRNLRKMTNSPGVGEARLMQDGQTLFFTYYSRTANWALMKQTAEGRIEEVFEGGTIDWDISPDEKYLAYYAFDKQSQRNRLFVQELESGKILKSFDIESLESLHWTPDGKALGYIRVGVDFEEIVRQPLDGAPEQVLINVRGEDLRNFAWSRDGRRIAVVRNKIQNELIMIQAAETK